MKDGSGVALFCVAALSAVFSGCGDGAPGPAGSHGADVPPVSTSPGTEGAVPWVDVFVGTANSNVKHSVLNGGGGSTFPGAALPFGMVQFSPDTPSAGPPGYFHPDEEILGFSLTHLNGAGCIAMRDFPLFPLLGELDASVEPLAKFSHADEIASPGFYEVTLSSGIKVDLTATKRTGLARFTFPRQADAKVLIAGSFQRDILGVFSFDAKVEGPDLVTGQRDDGFFCASETRYTVYFAARFDRPFTQHGMWSGGDTIPGADTVSGLRSGVYLGFDARERPVVQVKMGLSYVSRENALANLDAENPGWDFDAVHEAAITTWNEHLGRIEVEGGSDDDRKSLYSALYHVLLQPGVASDANGEYLGFDGKVAKADGHERYAQISGWDIYRSWVPLAAMLAPKETSDVMRSLVKSGEECGGAMPKWAIANQESSTMVGDPAAPIVASAWAFGARDFDAKKALALAVHAATDPEAACGGKVVRDGLAAYLARGYCPIDGPGAIWGSTSTTMEYAIADFAIAELADALGDASTRDTFLPRARSWMNVFDANREANGWKGYPAPRHLEDQDGAAHFDEVDVAVAVDGFVEGSPAQYTLMVPHDLGGLATALGGEKAALARLDAFFTEVNAGVDSPYLYIGNEPGFNAPWAYPFLGAPWRTQEVVRRSMNEAFAPTPEGLPGNDDLGSTSSWLVWAMLGMYPAIPGVGGFVLGSPTFSKATVTLAGGKRLTIVAKNAAKDAPYVQSLRVNGQDSTSTWVTWEAVAAGATLEFVLGSTPNEAWGSGAGDRPPVFYP